MKLWTYVVSTTVCATLASHGTIRAQYLPPGAAGGSESARGSDRAGNPGASRTPRRRQYLGSGGLPARPAAKTGGRPEIGFNAPAAGPRSAGGALPFAPGLTFATDYPGAHELGSVGRRLVSLETDHAEPMDAILNLMRSAGVSYVIGGDVLVGRKITARFQNVTLADALDALADAAGLNYHARGSILVLTGGGPDGFVFGQPGYRSMNNVPWNAFPSILPGAADNAPPASGNPIDFAAPSVPPASVSTPGTSSPDGVPLPDVKGTLPLSGVPLTSGVDVGPNVDPAGDQTVVLTLKYASADETAGIVRKALGSSRLRGVVADTRQNALVVTGSRDTCQEARVLVGRLDVAPMPILVKLHLFSQPGSVAGSWFGGPAAENDPEGFRLGVIDNAGSLDQLVMQVQRNGGRLVSSPVISTLDKRPAVVRLTGATPRNLASDGERLILEEFEILPQVNDDGSIRLTGSFRYEKGPAHPGPNETSMAQFVKQVPSGGTLAILGSRDPKGGRSRPAPAYLLLVSASVAGPKVASLSAGPSAAAGPDSKAAVERP